MESKEVWFAWRKRLVLGIFVLAVACPLATAGYSVYQDRINNAVVQPQQRQNIDQQATQRRLTEAQFRTAYANWQNELKAVDLDKNNLAMFIGQNGAPKGYPPYSSVANEYQQLFAAYTQDEQGLVNAISAYNALASNADTAPYRPAELPISLSLATPYATEQP